MATNSTLTRTVITWGSVAALSGLSAVFAWQWSGSGASRVTHTLLVQNQLGALLSGVQDVENGQRGYLLTNDKVYLQPYEAAIASIGQIQSELQRLTRDNPEQHALASEARDLIAKRISISQSTIDLFDSGKQSESLDLLRSGRGKAVMDQLRVVIGKAKTQEDQLFAQRQAQYDRQRALLLAALLGTLLASAGLAFLALRREQEKADLLAITAKSLASDKEELAQRVALRTAELEVERNRAETERGRAEALLRDVTHRIGNNLALVVGFLNLHIRHASDPGTVQTLMGARSRVHAIASAQRRINVISDLDLVRIDTLLDAVMSDLAEAMPENETKITLEVPPLLAEAQVATSVCVLTQEFVMNALKHAFPAGEAGTIIVRLTRDSDGLVVLTVIDNGQGRADSETAAADGLGTKIANLLASQFGGTITYKVSVEGGMSTGTTVVVELPRLKMQPADQNSDQAAASARSDAAENPARRSG